MNFKTIILSPIALIYGTILLVRNKMYDKKIIKATSFTFPIICIGNLTVGGTGKTPHTNYLINLLKNEYNIAVLSRGYNRKTSGYIELEIDSLAENVGDEPLFYKWKHNDIKVAVCEDRVFGISKMAIDEEKEYVYLLDDAFQHRSIKAGINLLITDYSNLYSRDYLLPSGSLREGRKGSKRADIVVVSKCPSPISIDKKKEIKKELKLENYQHLFFSTMVYKPIYPIFQNQHIEDEKITDVILISGIANTKPLLKQLNSRFRNVYERAFSDHHNYTKEDIHSIVRTFNNLETSNKILITTEKDATRLFAYKKIFLKEDINIFCIPIEVIFENEEKHSFDKAIKHYLNITLPKIEEIENLDYD